jgi:hypothetical protein
MEGFKIYNICLDKLTESIDAVRKGDCEMIHMDGRILVESYKTADVEEIIRILGLHDIKERNKEGLRDKLDDLSLTLSCFTQEELEFDFSEQGELGLYLSVKK